MTRKKEIGEGSRVKKTTNEKALFEFSAPEAREVHLSGDFNGWNNISNPMKRDRNGLWKATLPLAPGRYEYRFLVDGQWENDLSCSCFVPNLFGSMNIVRTIE
jgi:1,4-alpha-glucan branching enzyme